VYNLWITYIVDNQRVMNKLTNCHCKTDKLCIKSVGNVKNLCYLVFIIPNKRGYIKNTIYESFHIYCILSNKMDTNTNKMINKVKIMTKTTQIKETKDDNNSCTVLALKSVTGWAETKCQTILSNGGRQTNRGFDIKGFFEKCKGKVKNVKFTKVKDCRYYRYNNTSTLKNFATHRNKGVYYVTTNNHALAIINGIIVDNLTGRQAGDRREVRHVWKVTGNIKPNIGVVNKSDTAPKKRYEKLDYGEEVIYKGKIIKYKDIILAKKGDLVRVNNRNSNGLVVLKFFHPVDNYTITAKLDRELFQVTEKRKADIFKDINIIKKQKTK